MTALPAIEVWAADVRYAAPDASLGLGRRLEASGVFGGMLTPYGAWWAKLVTEDLDRREWIAGVKQRLGLVQIGDAR